MISKNNKAVYAKLTTEIYDGIFKLAKARKRSMSFIVSEIIEEYLAKNKK